MVIFNQNNTKANIYSDLLDHAIGQSTNRNMLSLHCIEIINQHKTNHLSAINIDLIERYGLNAFRYFEEEKILDYKNNIIIPALTDSFKAELITISQLINEHFE